MHGHMEDNSISLEVLVLGKAAGPAVDALDDVLVEGGEVGLAVVRAVCHGNGVDFGGRRNLGKVGKRGQLFFSLELPVI